MKLFCYETLTLCDATLGDCFDCRQFFGSMGHKVGSLLPADEKNAGDLKIGRESNRYVHVI